MTIDLAKVAKERKIKYFLISYVDLFGGLRAKLAPAAAIEGMQRDGAGFAGFATWLDMTPADSDLFAKPDPESLIQLPWKPEVGWLAADLWMDGKEVAASPRKVLKDQIAAAAAKGYRMKSGVECEYFLITPDGKAISDPADIQEKPCYDQQALMRRYDVITEICDSMLTLGWKPYQNDHEDANGQFEMNWEYDDCMKTADRHVFFKYMVKALAEKHGFRATFMPKPFMNLTGNGCHAHVSVWDKTGKTNLFHDAKGELGLSKLAYSFLGGDHAQRGGPLRVLQSHGQQLQAHQRAAHHFGRDLVAELDHLWRQQPHPYGAHPRRRALRTAPDGWGGEPLSAAGRRAGGRARRCRQPARPGQAPRHQHVHRGPHG